MYTTMSRVIKRLRTRIAIVANAIACAWNITNLKSIEREIVLCKAEVCELGKILDEIPKENYIDLIGIVGRKFDAEKKVVALEKAKSKYKNKKVK